MDNKATRRAVLGAIAALPAVAAAAPALAQSATIDRSEWDRAFAEYEAIEQEKLRYDREVYSPAYDRAKAATAHLPEPSDDCTIHELHAYNIERNRLGEIAVPGLCAMGQHYDALSNRWAELQFAMCRIPAPTIRELAWKLEAMFGDADAEGYCDSLSMDVVRVAIDDAHRLATREG